MKNQKKLEDKIEDIQLENMSQSQIQKTVKSLSAEGMKIRAERKKIRYQLYRLRTESEGKCSADVTDEFRESFEKQALFAGWRFFATNWDVAFDDPMRIVNRDLSEQEEWNEVVAAKFPTISHDGKVSYPDINVRKAVESYAKEREALEAKKAKKKVAKKKSSKKVQKKVSKKTTGK